MAVSRQAKKTATNKQKSGSSAAKKTGSATKGRRAETQLKQVSPFKPDPNKYARYQLVQNNFEVGFVYVKGISVKKCIETWQLYDAGASGGQGSYGFKRELYLYPSYQSSPTESKDVTTRFIFRDVVDVITAPSGLGETDYQTIVADCS